VLGVEVQKLLLSVAAGEDRDMVDARVGRHRATRLDRVLPLELSGEVLLPEGEHGALGRGKRCGVNVEHGSNTYGSGVIGCFIIQTTPAIPVPHPSVAPADSADRK